LTLALVIAIANEFVAGRLEREHAMAGRSRRLFLVAGTFFPLSSLPEWAQYLGNVNPLHHCVELVRHAAFGWDGWADLARLARSYSSASSSGGSPSTR